MHTFPRPQQHRLYEERIPAEGICPECRQSDLRRYRVLSEGGWWDVVKCQACLYSLSREASPPLGSFKPLGTAVDAQPAPWKEGTTA